MALLNDITLGQYYPADSILHQLDPRSKLLSCLVITTCLLLSNGLYLFAVQSVLCVFALYASKIPLKVFARNLKWFLWLFLITFSIHLLEVQFAATSPFLHFKLTEQGLVNGIAYTMRLALLITFASLLTMTSSPIELTDSLEKLFSPFKRFKLPIQEFALMMTLSLRFIPILLREAERIRNAQLSRGLSLEGSLLKRVRSIIPMMLPLFISALGRANDLAIAMEARRYTGGEGRTSFKKLAFKRADFGLLFFSTAFMFVILMIR